METTYFDPAQLDSSQYGKMHDPVPLPQAVQAAIYPDRWPRDSKETMAENGRQYAFEKLKAI
jgi:hypothetical protein